MIGPKTAYDIFMEVLWKCNVDKGVLSIYVFIINVECIFVEIYLTRNSIIHDNNLLFRIIIYSILPTS